MFDATLGMQAHRGDHHIYAAASLRLARLLFGALFGFEIFDDGGQHVFRVIAQFDLGHVRSGPHQSARERTEFSDDDVMVPRDEVTRRERSAASARELHALDHLPVHHLGAEPRIFGNREAGTAPFAHADFQFGGHEGATVCIGIDPKASAEPFGCLAISDMLEVPRCAKFS